MIEIYKVEFGFQNKCFVDFEKAKQFFEFQKTKNKQVGLWKICKEHTGKVYKIVEELLNSSS